MNDTDNQYKKILKLIKILSFGLLLYSIIPILLLLGYWLYPELSAKYNIVIYEEVIIQISILLFCTIGGIGLLKNKIWAFYLVVIPGIINLFAICLGFMTFIIALRAGKAIPPNLFLIFIKTIYGIISVYLYRNKDVILKIFFKKIYITTPR